MYGQPIVLGGWLVEFHINLELNPICPTSNFLLYIC